MKYSLLNMDVIEGLRTLPSESVQVCVTSPPYWNLRDYGVPGQIGLEPTIDAYVQKMVEVFREVRRVLRNDGTLWLNLGDSYAGGAGGRGDSGRQFHEEGGGGPASAKHDGKRIPRSMDGLKPKDLCMVPARVALALQADGYYLRSEIIWHKKAPMPESVTDRPTSAHEKIFLLSKSAKYYYDADAVRETKVETTVRDLRDSGNGHRRERQYPGQPSNGGTNLGGPNGDRNLRNVWTLSPEPCAEAHFAVFPSIIPKRAILAGSKEGDTVLDCFAGSGTSLAVAVSLGRRAIGIEINPEYACLAHRRIAPYAAQERLPL